MVTRENLERIEELSKGILDHLENAGHPLGAATLLREFCQQNTVDAEIAEVALSFLFNKGLVEIDRDMLLNRQEAVEAM